MKNLFWGIFWIGVYLALVLTPLIALLVGETPGGAGFWWDFSIGLGFAGLAMMGVQFILTARFRRATAPYGIDIIYFFHRYLAIIALADRRDPRPLILFSGHSSWERATLRESVEELKERLDLRLVHVLEEPHEGWEGEIGYMNAEMLDRHLPPERSDFEYFICGPVPMIEAVEKALHELGVPMAKDHTELFDLV